MIYELLLLMPGHWNHDWDWKNPGWINITCGGGYKFNQAEAKGAVKGEKPGQLVGKMRLRIDGSCEYHPVTHHINGTPK